MQLGNKTIVVTGVSSASARRPRACCASTARA